MAISSISSELDICNMALGRIGEQVITDAQLTANTDKRAVQCNLHYANTRDALLRSHYWRFAKARSSLTATTTPSFEWDYAFTLPTDFLREKSVYDDNLSIRRKTPYTYELEGSTLLTDESSCKLRYIKKVTTVTSFDPLFIEILVRQLALKFIPAIAGVGTAAQMLMREIKDELYGSPKQPGLMAKVMTLDRQEGERIGRSDRQLWNTSRSSNSGRIDSKLGSA